MTTRSIYTRRQGPLTPAGLAPVAAGGCHAWGFNGSGQTGLIPSSAVVETVVDVWDQPYGLYPDDGLYPDEPLLPGPGVWTIGGTIYCTFNLNPGSGEISIHLAGVHLDTGPPPVAAAGSIIGRAIPRATTTATVHFHGTVFTTDPWVPTLLVVNSLNRSIVTGAVSFHAFGSCPAEHGGTTGGS